MIESWISNAVVWAWTVVAAVGLGFSIWGLRHAKADRAWLLANNLNGARSIVTGATIRRERIRCVTNGLLILSGILVGLTPLPHGTLVGMVGITRVVFRVTTLAIAISQLENSITDYRTRCRID